VTYRSRNKIYGNPFLQRDCPSILARMQSSVDHKFFCVIHKFIKNRSNEGMLVACRTHVYPMKSPRLMVSMSCSVTLIISCLRTRTPSSSSVLLFDESDDSFTFSSDPSPLALAMTLLPVRNVYVNAKVL
jgi:hypothetical protein